MSSRFEGRRAPLFADIEDEFSEIHRRTIEAAFDEWLSSNGCARGFSIIVTHRPGLRIPEDYDPCEYLRRNADGFRPDILVVPYEGMLEDSGYYSEDNRKFRDLHGDMEIAYLGMKPPRRTGGFR